MSMAVKSWVELDRKSLFPMSSSGLLRMNIKWVWSSSRFIHVFMRSIETCDLWPSLQFWQHWFDAFLPTFHSFRAVPCNWIVFCRLSWRHSSYSRRKRRVSDRFRSNLIPQPNSRLMSSFCVLFFHPPFPACLSFSLQVRTHQASLHATSYEELRSLIIERLC